MVVVDIHVINRHWPLFTIDNFPYCFEGNSYLVTLVKHSQPLLAVIKTYQNQFIILNPLTLSYCCYWSICCLESAHMDFWRTDTAEANGLLGGWVHHHWVHQRPLQLIALTSLRNWWVWIGLLVQSGKSLMIDPYTQLGVSQNRKPSNHQILTIYRNKSSILWVPHGLKPPIVVGFHTDLTPLFWTTVEPLLQVEEMFSFDTFMVDPGVRINS